MLFFCVPLHVVKLMSLILSWMRDSLKFFDSTWLHWSYVLSASPLPTKTSHLPGLNSVDLCWNGSGELVECDWVWSPHGWVTATCLALCSSWDFSGVQSCADCTKVLWVETVNWEPPTLPPMCVCTLNIVWSMSEFGGLWKHQNNTACTKSVRVLKVLKLDTI